MTKSAVLHFKDSLGAFEYACKYTPSALAVGEKALAMVVLDSIDKTGDQILVLRLAGPNRTEVAGIPIDPRLRVKAGDLVIYRLERLLPEVAAPFNTFGVVGAKVAPEWSNESGWKLIDFPGLYARPSFALRVGQHLRRIFRK